MRVGGEDQQLRIGSDDGVRRLGKANKVGTDWSG